ncbi:MAG: alpha/beta fold hydrolase, partial [Ekhidna sp.]
MNSTAFSQSWVDTTLYPFENKFLRLEAGNMHYVDEGKGEIILFVHGTPTWSFLYRDFVKELSKEYRCIAIDHLGFGLSDKPDSIPGTPEWHSQNLSEFIRKLDLQNTTLVVHDFGGPIGLAAGIENSERIKKVVLFNSWLWATDQKKEAQKIDKTINSWLGKFLYLNMNFSPKVLLKKGFANKKNLSKEVHQQYIKPFPDKSS